MKKLYLASTSPRRAELLSQLGLDFELVNAPIEEVGLPNESPESFIRRMAIEKATDGFNKLAGDVWVIAGDTALVVDNKVLGKPRNKADAMKMWRLISGREHKVLSSVALMHDGVVFCELNETQVFMREITQAEMESYWATGEPQDKAGAYAIQGLGSKFIKRIEGSYSGVMGLPLYELNQILEKAGFYE